MLVTVIILMVVVIAEAVALFHYDKKVYFLRVENDEKEAKYKQLLETYDYTTEKLAENENGVKDLATRLALEKAKVEKLEIELDKAKKSVQTKPAVKKSQKKNG